MSSKNQSTSEPIDWNDEIDVFEVLDFGDRFDVVIAEDSTSERRDAISYCFGTRVEIVPAGLNFSAGDRVNVKVTLVRKNSIETIAVTTVEG